MVAKVDDLSDLKNQLLSLQQQMTQLQTKIQQFEKAGSSQANLVPSVPAKPALAGKSSDNVSQHHFFERKPGTSVTFYR